jgi:nucleoside-diphosphate-sugar epimerase
VSDLHVVFGAGQVGSQLAGVLRNKGKRVRIVRRSAGAVGDGIEVITGDAADPAFCHSAVQGAAAVYHCMNPDYDTDLWAHFVPLWTENLIGAAGAAGARLVVLDNLYMYGRPDAPIDEDTPFAPRSRKGEIRARNSEALFAAHRRGDARVVLGRASDFYGPGGVGTHFADRFWEPVLAGKTARMLLDPDVPHSYNYIPDVAIGLATLGLAADDALGRVWMLPVTPATSARELAQHFSEELGREIRVAKTPRAMVKLLGLFMPIVKEIGEMLHQWDGPFIVNDRRFRERFGVEPTPMADAARETVAWAKGEYGRA